MFIEYGFDIEIYVGQSTAILTLLDIHPTRERCVLNDRFECSCSPGGGSVFLDPFGNRARVFSLQPGRHTFHRRGIVLDSGELDDMAPFARPAPLDRLPGEIYQYLLGSRYCETDLLAPLALAQFGQIAAGWPQVQAVCDYVNRALEFNYALARPTRSAAQALNEGTGVCRDFAHTAITLCRALNIPARYATGYLGDIGVPQDPAPMDFSAWFEVYLDGRWYTFDARHNRRRIGRVVMAYGRDASDAALITSFGTHTLNRFTVVTTEVPRARSIAA